MRKFFYVLLGILFIAGAVGTFGVRQLGWDAGSMVSGDSGARSFGANDRGGGGGHRHYDGAGRGGGRSLFSFATVLDLLNVVVGVIGIVLTIGGLRMQRNAMQMSMRSKD